MKNIGISYIEVYVPKKVLTNDDLSQMVDTNDEWITKRTGIKERHIAADNETTIDLANAAVQKIYEKNASELSEVDFIICSTGTHNQKFPSLAGHVHKKFLNGKDIPFIDINPACSGFVYALEMARSFVQSGLAKKVLCVCAEKMSEIVDWTDRNTCVLFGDAAAAFLVEENPKLCSVVDAVIGGNGEYTDLLHATNDNGQSFVTMDGTQVFKIAVRIMTEKVQQVCSRANKNIDDIDLLVPHQANARIMTSVADMLGIPHEKAFMNVSKYGNTSSVTIPLALYEALQSGAIKKGSLVATPALGGGFTWGATLLQF